MGRVQVALGGALALEALLQAGPPVPTLQGGWVSGRRVLSFPRGRRPWDSGQLSAGALFLGLLPTFSAFVGFL